MTGTVTQLRSPHTPPNDRLWGEPFIISAVDPETKTDVCEPTDVECPEPARWMVEVVGYVGRDDAPWLHPVRYCCNGHLIPTLEEFAEQEVTG